MTEAGYALESTRSVSSLARPRAGRRAAMSTALWAFVAGNAALMVWLWVHGGNDDLTTGELLTSLARITGLLGAAAGAAARPPACLRWSGCSASTASLQAAILKAMR